ncbi:hypothetical protein Fleli_0717 [Bernardetia litoralis DSM 6794]|uniref:Glycosyltransferase RgtA/B/C/D-like domain-containing protein n=1 Tax=Bernardetia litoralis (strain ATCC 23117 / DSM 6794 / NBRC 15988 / NCIMB 1366 / Fx l1 / Sio-4) TaxID=880071 RepID=I4AGU2_BERLS|nr:hypothetical protein [Bernardetia litoralis]AFM03177.1 hypothetical protein Fleli_0717 [Bernardetia litoralis DSM 6794]
MPIYITLQDLFLTPIYLLLIYSVLYFLRTSILDKEMRKFFIMGYTVKVVGAIFFGLVFQFVYGYGDTFFYFAGASIAREAFFENIDMYFQILFQNMDEYSDSHTYYYAYRMPYYGDKSSFTINKIGSVFSILSFNTYTINSLFFALLSFAGSWQMYKAWVDIYPVLKKQLAWAIFFIPSIFFWASGIVKDSVTFAALTFAFAAFHFGIICRRKVYINILVFLLCCYVLYIIKPYILLCFIPACGWWFYSQYTKQIKSPFLKGVFAPILLVVGGGLVFYSFTNLIKGTEYDLDRVAQKAFITADWIHQMSAEGSAYDIGLDQMDGTIGGMLKLYPKGIFITLFRPFVWEIKNFNMALAALENLILLFLTFQVFKNQKWGVILKRLKTEQMVIVCLIFTFFFSGIIGIVSSNFGTLVRYRIPILPFYTIALIILGYKRPKKRKLRKIKI